MIKKNTQLLLFFLFDKITTIDDTRKLGKIRKDEFAT